MARVVLAWELGAGMGHVGIYRSLLQTLSARGHEAAVIARDTAAAQRLLGDLELRILQAPVLAQAGPFARMRQGSYADLLWGVGYSDPVGLRGRIKAWQRLYAWLRPQLLIADHSPTALLAARGSALPCIPSGSGFLIPPRLSPMPALRFWEPLPEAVLQAAEQRVLANLNAALADLGEAGMERLEQLFAADAQFLLSFAEIDHYVARPPAEYLGVPLSAGYGDAPPWPSPSAQPRLLVYLAAAPGVQTFLHLLGRGAYPALVYAPRLPPAVRQACTNANVRVLDAPLDVAAAAAQCTLAVTNANFATSTAVLLQGKPLLLFPGTVEQEIFARRIERLGAALIGSRGTEEVLAGCLDRLLGETAYARTAAEFARCHAGFDPAVLRERMADTVEALAAP